MIPIGADAQVDISLHWIIAGVLWVSYIAYVVIIEPRRKR